MGEIKMRNMLKNIGYKILPFAAAYSMLSPAALAQDSEGTGEGTGEEVTNEGTGEGSGVGILVTYTPPSNPGSQAADVTTVEAEPTSQPTN